MGWQVDRHMQDSLVIEALRKVILLRKTPSGMIVHSDGGGQYKSIAFRELIARQEFVQSMTRKDNHYDNAFSESLFSRFKTELMVQGGFGGLQDARLQIFEYIEGYYNTIRKHSGIGYLSPMEFEDKYVENLNVY